MVDMSAGILTCSVHVVRHVVLVDVALYAGQHRHLAPPRARDTGRRAVLRWALLIYILFNIQRQ